MEALLELYGGTLDCDVIKIIYDNNWGNVAKSELELRQLAGLGSLEVTPAFAQPIPSRQHSAQPPPQTYARTVRGRSSPRSTHGRMAPSVAPPGGGRLLPSGAAAGGGRRSSALPGSVQEKLAAGVPLLVLLRGLPGSGKTTLARQLLERRDGGVVCSADAFFTDRSGRYRFEAARLPEAHQWCQQRVRRALAAGRTPVVVDNTNTQAWEMLPYVQMAARFHYHVELLEPTTSWRWEPRVLARKNTHKVPLEKIEHMLNRYQDSDEITVKTLFRSAGKTPLPWPTKAPERKASAGKLTLAQFSSATVAQPSSQRPSSADISGLLLSLSPAAAEQDGPVGRLPERLPATGSSTEDLSQSVSTATTGALASVMVPELAATVDVFAKSGVETQTPPAELGVETPAGLGVETLAELGVETPPVELGIEIPAQLGVETFSQPLLLSEASTPVGPSPTRNAPAAEAHWTAADTSKVDHFSLELNGIPGGTEDQSTGLVMASAPIQAVPEASARVELGVATKNTFGLIVEDILERSSPGEPVQGSDVQDDSVPTAPAMSSRSDEINSNADGISITMAVTGDGASGAESDAVSVNQNESGSKTGLHLPNQLSTPQLSELVACLPPSLMKPVQQRDREVAPVEASPVLQEGEPLPPSAPCGWTVEESPVLQRVVRAEESPELQGAALLLPSASLGWSAAGEAERRRLWSASTGSVAQSATGRVAETGALRVDRSVQTGAASAGRRLAARARPLATAAPSPVALAVQLRPRLDKGTMPSPPPSPSPDAALAHLCALFPRTSRADLQHVLEQCAGDVNWATNLLLDSAPQRDEPDGGASEMDCTPQRSPSPQRDEEGDTAPPPEAVTQASNSTVGGLVPYDSTDSDPDVIVETFSQSSGTDGLSMSQMSVSGSCSSISSAACLALPQDGVVAACEAFPQDGAAAACAALRQDRAMAAAGATDGARVDALKLADFSSMRRRSLLQKEELHTASEPELDLPTIRSADAAAAATCSGTVPAWAMCDTPAATEQPADSGPSSPRSEVSLPPSRVSSSRSEMSSPRSEVSERGDGGAVLRLTLPGEFLSQLEQLFGPPPLATGSGMEAAATPAIRQSHTVELSLWQARSLHRAWLATCARAAAQSQQLQISSPAADERTGTLLTDEQMARQLQLEEDRRVASESRRPPAASPTPQLREIMDLEQALRDSQQEMGASRDTQAGRLTRDRLHAEYPGVDGGYLDELLDMHDGNYQQVVEVLYGTRGDRPVPQPALRPPPNEEPSGDGWSAGDDADGLPSFQQLQAEAEALRRRELYCDIMIKRCRSRRLPGVAEYYVKERERCAALRAASELRAAVTAVELRHGDNPHRLDLHQLRVEHALIVLASFITERQLEYSKQGYRKKVVEVITGRGNNSRRGKAKIKPAVVNWLIAHRFKFEEASNNAGMLLLTIEATAPSSL